MRPDPAAVIVARIALLRRIVDPGMRVQFAAAAAATERIAQIAQQAAVILVLWARAVDAATKARRPHGTRMTRRRSGRDVRFAGGRRHNVMRGAVATGTRGATNASRHAQGAPRHGRHGHAMQFHRQSPSTARGSGRIATHFHLSAVKVREIEKIATIGRV
jgi:hypothetical protein